MKRTKIYIFLLLLPLILFILIIILNSLGKSTTTSSNYCNNLPATGVITPQEEACSNIKTGSTNSLSSLTSILGFIAGILLLFGTPFGLLNLLNLIITTRLSILWTNPRILSPLQHNRQVVCPYRAAETRKTTPG